jgi:transcription initiation factor TFIIB
MNLHTNETNETNKTNKTTKTNETNKTGKINDIVNVDVDESGIDNITDIQELDFNDDELFALMDNMDAPNYGNGENEGVSNNGYPDNDFSRKSFDEIINKNLNNQNIKKVKKKEKEKISCDKCNTDKYLGEDYTSGILVCKNCGTVLRNIMDETPEWRSYDNGHRTTNGRCSGPTNVYMPQASLGTSISGYGMNKLRMLHNWSKMIYRERSINTVFKYIHSKCVAGKILKCIEDDARALYFNINECKHSTGKNKGKYIIKRGRNRKSLIASCVYFACKKNKKTRSPKEIANLFELKYTEFTRGCKTFLKSMKIRKMEYSYNTSTSEHFVPRFCKQLKINKIYICQALQIVKNIQNLNIASKHTPLSVATGVILLISEINNLPITKKNISINFEVSEVTITKTYKVLCRYKHIILNTELTNKYVKQLEVKKKATTMSNSLATIFSDRGMNLNKYDDIIDDDSEDIEYDFDFDINNGNVDDYIDTINIDTYDSMSATNYEYKKVLTEISTVL